VGSMFANSGIPKEQNKQKLKINEENKKLA
jgi:hypothetical protein